MGEMLSSSHTGGELSPDLEAFKASEYAEDALAMMSAVTRDRAGEAVSGYYLRHGTNEPGDPSTGFE